MIETINIPIDKAIKICKEIRKEIKLNRFNFIGHQCLGCIKFGKDDPKKMLFHKTLYNSGCNLVNARYLKEIHSS